MNNTKMVSVPREEIELTVHCLRMAGESISADELQVYLDQPAEQHQGEPVWYMTENGLSATHAKMKGLSDRQGWDTSDYSVPLYTRADPNVADEKMQVISGLRAQLADLKQRHDGLHRDMATIAGREVPKGCTVADYAAASIADALSASAEPSAPSSCTWTYNDDSFAWDTTCSESFLLMDDGPKENCMKFCCYCSKPIIQAPHKAEP